MRTSLRLSGRRSGRSYKRFSGILFGIWCLLSGLFQAEVHAQEPYRITARKVFNVRSAMEDSMLFDGDRLGSSFARLGSFPGLPPGTLIATGLQGSDGPDGTLTRSGSTWMLHLKPNGKIVFVSRLDADNIVELDEFEGFGDALTTIGDIDGDGLTELVVGAPFSEVGGQEDVGAVYLCFFNPDGSLREYRYITNGSNGLPPGLIPAESWFGSDLAPVGDLDGNGVTDLAVSAPHDNIGGILTGGAFYLLFLDNTGAIIQHRVVNPSEPLLNGRIGNGDFFGSGMAYLGNFGPGADEMLAVGAYGADASGRVHLLSFTSAGVVNRNLEISFDLPLLAGVIDSGDAFGFALANIGDLNGDGFMELAVSAPGDDDSEDGINDKGAVYVLYLNEFGEPVQYDKISEISGGLNSSLSPSDFFGCSIGAPGDVDQDGIPDLLIGARNKAVDGLRPGNFFLLKQLYCRIPTNPVAFVSSPSSLVLNWDDQPDYKGYLVQFRATGTSAWSSNIVVTNTFSVDTLEPGETYDWRIATGCGGGSTSYNTDIITLTMPPLRESAITVQSNPVRGALSLLLTGAASDVPGTLRIWAQDGRLVYHKSMIRDAASQYISLPESAIWPQGIYWAEWQGGDVPVRSAPIQLLH